VGESAGAQDYGIADGDSEAAANGDGQADAKGDGRTDVDDEDVADAEGDSAPGPDGENVTGDGRAVDADADVASQLAEIWAMIADADPELAKRLPRYLGPSS
jgi:hypothetical protein